MFELDTIVGRAMTNGILNRFPLSLWVALRLQRRPELIWYLFRPVYRQSRPS